jgi:hypothetical protein
MHGRPWMMAPRARSKGARVCAYARVKRNRSLDRRSDGRWPWSECRSWSQAGVSRVPLETTASRRRRHSPPAPCIQRLGHRLVVRGDRGHRADTGVDANENVVR